MKLHLSHIKIILAFICTIIYKSKINLKCFTNEKRKKIHELTAFAASIMHVEMTMHSYLKNIFNLIKI